MTMKVYARGHRKSGDGGHEGYAHDLTDRTRFCKTKRCTITNKSYCGDRDTPRIEDDERFKIQDCGNSAKAYMANSSRFETCVYKTLVGTCIDSKHFEYCSTACGNNIKGYKTDARNPCWDTNKRGFVNPGDGKENVGFVDIDGPYLGGFFGLQCEYTPNEAQVVKSSGIDEHTSTTGFDGVRIKDTELSPTVQNKWGTIYHQLKWGARVPWFFDTREQGLCSKPENSEEKVDTKEPKATTCFEDGRIQWSGYLKDGNNPNAYRSKQYKEVALHHCTKVPNAEDNLRDKIFKTGSSDKKCHTYFRNEVDEKDLIEKFCLKTENSGPVNMTKSENNDLCSRRRMGDNKYEAMAAQYCLNNPTDLWCGCYNAVENKCKIDESLPGCNENLETWEQMKSGLSSDESALFSGMRQCFKNVCAGNKYKPNNWKEACNRRVNICKSEIDIAGKMVDSTIIDQQDCNNEGAPPPSIKPLSKTDKFLENIFSFREDQDKKFMEKRYVKISIAILLILILGAVISGTIIIV